MTRSGCTPKSPLAAMPSIVTDVVRPMASRPVVVLMPCSSIRTLEKGETSVISSMMRPS